MKKTLSILGIMPESIGGRLTSSSIFDGFFQSGHKIIIFDTLYDNKEIIKNYLEEYNFNFIVSYDYTAIIYKILFNLDIPTINYFSDVIDDIHAGDYWKKYYNYLKNQDNYTFYWDKELYLQKKKEIPNLFYMPHFVNTDIYKNMDIQKKYDIMFAGRLDSDFRLNTVIKLMKKFSEQKFAWFSFEKHYEDVISRLHTQEEKELIKKNYQGFINNEKDMALEINQSKIVFNFNAQGISSLNYRTFQVMACETLLLSDYRKESEELFTPNKNFIIFNSIQELEKKIEFFLKNQEEYKTIVKEQRKAVEKNHSSKVCIEKMLDCIN